MNMPEAEENRREIIIVKRRRSDDEGGHHGGVWKIAFADFMTAMMCFFLVLWLVNATSDQTKAAIASYFNPMTLVETAPSSKGLDDASKKKAPTSSDQSYPVESDNENRGANHHERGGPGQFANSVSHDDTHKTSDQHLFADPYAVLAEIAAQTASLQNISEKGDGGRQSSGPATGAHGGESYRDPFAPDFWSHEVATADEDAELDVFRNSEPEESSPETSPVVAEEQAEPPHDDPKEEIPAGVTDTPASQLAEQLRVEINDSFGRDSALNKAISISVEGDGVLISVTEELDFGMFEIGSAVPKGELVLAMEKIGAVLDKHSGSIRINGHTDGRPFSNENYDNWRLSTARAHSAYYMLVRTGIDETRIKEVAGFADRRLKVTSDPLANVNRRIEIFLEPER